MDRLLKISLALLTFLAALSLHPAGAAPSEKRFALVIGNATYKAKALATPVNDAALIAQTLQAAGFDVMGARDLDEDLLRQAFLDFFDRVTKAGPDAVAVVYFAGYGLQLDGENYLLPIDADITDTSDLSVKTLRLSEQTHALAALHVKTAFVILDAARASPFVLSGQPPAGGLAWVEPETNMMIAFNAAPGTVSPDDGDGYGPYAKSLAEMIREGGLTPANLFDRVRLRVNELTKGAQVPWDSSKIETQFMFFERGPGAPPRADSPEQTAWMRSQPMRSLAANDAYMVALIRDTLDAYADFLADYWHDPMTKRVGALLAVRREAVTWRRTYQANVPDAYWSYLERYPRGPHVADARRLLTHLGATIAPPSKFAMMEYDVPPPLPDELEYIERTVLVLNDPAFAFEPPQPPPAYFLEPPPQFLALAPPAAPSEAYILPAPILVSLPAYVSVPAIVAAPPNPRTFDDAHETPIIDNVNGLPTKREGHAAGPRLPPSVAPKAMLIDSQRPPAPAVNPVASEEIKVPQGSPLPTVSLTPPWPTDNETPIRPGIELPALAANNEAPPVREPTMQAPPPTGIPLRTRRTAMLSPQPVGSIPLPRPRPTDNETSAMPGIEPPVLTTNNEPSVPDRTMLAPPTPLQTPGEAMPSPQTTGFVPLPRPRPIGRARLPTRNRSKPITQAASTSSIEVDQAAQPTGPLLDRLTRWTHSAPAPNVTPGVSPPKPQKKLCPIVNGSRICS